MEYWWQPENTPEAFLNGIILYSVVTLVMMAIPFLGLLRITPEYYYEIKPEWFMDPEAGILIMLFAGSAIWFVLFWLHPTIPVARLTLARSVCSS